MYRDSKTSFMGRLDEKRGERPLYISSRMASYLDTGWEPP